MDCFSKYYDRLVGADYNKIIDFIVRSIKKYKNDSELVCDLGCGTGTVAIGLSQRGYDMIGIDSSEDMLIKAYENIKVNNADDILLLCQDICDFELYGTVDVIYSTLDTINYILDKRDLNRLFKLVKNYLNYDGLFIFDINTEHKFKDILGDNMFVYDEDDLYCIWNSHFDKKSDICEHYLTYFEKDNAEKFERNDIYQAQRFYDLDYIKSMLLKYGFEVLEVCDNYEKTDVTKKTERVTFVVKINK